MLREKIVPPEGLLIYDKDTGRTEFLRDKWGLKATSDAKVVCREADRILIAVKPQNMDELIEEIRDFLSEQLIISIVAGMQINSLLERAGKPLRVVRIMPNTPCLVGEGMSIISRGKGVSDSEEELVKNIMGALGKVIPLEENLLDAAAGLSGCGPAYCLLVLEALADGGVEVGLNWETASMLAVQTMLGTARMVRETKEHPASLKNKVTSPGGLTSAGLLALEKGAVRSSMIEAVVEAVKRGNQLGS
jgi:pyrroline-5-carboxylate reductase